MFVNLELTQSICEGRGVPRALWKYFNKEKIERSFKMKTESKFRNSTIKLIRLGQNQ